MLKPSFDPAHTARVSTVEGLGVPVSGLISRAAALRIITILFTLGALLLMAGTAHAQADAPSDGNLPADCADTSKDFPGFDAKACTPNCPAGTDLTFSIVEAKGCFTREGDKYVLRKPAESGGGGDGTVTLNGLKQTPLGADSVFELEPPTVEGGKGHVRSQRFNAGAPGLVGGLLPGSCCGFDIPAKERGDEIEVFKIPPPVQDTWYGLQVAGEFTYSLGWDKTSGKRYTQVSGHLKLPKIFQSGPVSDAGKQDAGTIGFAFGGKVSEDGWKLAGQVNVKNAWVGGVKLNNLCLSYVDAGVGKACAVKAGEDKIFNCGGGKDGVRWDGSVEVAFPSPTQEERGVGVTAGLSDGSLSYIGGYVSGLKIPIATSVTLTKLGGGICIQPPPFQFSGTVGMELGPGKFFDFQGLFNYVNSDPWEVSLRGTLERNERKILSGGIKYKAGRSFEVDVAGALYLPRRDDVKEEKAKSLLALEGGINGWMEFQPFKVNVAGIVKVCALNFACASGEGVVSTRGIGGCVKLVSIPYPYLEKTGKWTWRNTFPYRWVTRYQDVSAGGGYPWAGPAHTFASSCDFSSVEEKRTVAAAASAVDHRTLTIPAHLPAATIVVHGTGGPPRLKLTGPGGTTIAPQQPAVFSHGHYDYIEDAEHNTSSIVIAKPEGGVWKVSDVHGRTLQTVNLARATVPSTILAGVGQPDHDPYAKVLGYTYVPQAAHTLQFFERNAHDGVAHLIGTAEGKPCGHHSDDSRPKTGYSAPSATRCGELHFTPVEGPADDRNIIAVESEHGIPTHERVVATYRAPKEAPPAAVHGLHLIRFGETVKATWKAPRHADSIALTALYDVVLTTKDGLREVVVAKPDHRSAEFNGIADWDAVSVTVTPLRDDQGERPGLTKQLDGTRQVPEGNR